LCLQQELENSTNELAAYLVDEVKVQTGDRVLLVFTPGLQFTASLVACFKAGVIGVPVFPPNPTMLGKDLLRFTAIQEDCGAKVALTHAEYSFAKTVSDVKGFFSFGSKKHAWPDLKWIQVDNLLNKGRSMKTTADSTLSCLRLQPQSEIAFLQYTSGSTGSPKGVMVTHQCLAANVVAMERHFARECRDSIVGVTWLPQYHDMGLIGAYLRVTYCGGSCHGISPLTFLKDPLVLIRMIDQHKANYMGVSVAFSLAFVRFMLRSFFNCMFAVLFCAV
jgi:acyl-CoA synthetase (AMP-forming)/AMP-acid ligase II